MIICGQEYSHYDLVCAALVASLVIMAVLAITTFFFFTLVVFGGPTY